jgi:hypothetical protein
MIQLNSLPRIGNKADTPHRAMMLDTNRPISRPALENRAEQGTEFVKFAQTVNTPA